MHQILDNYFIMSSTRYWHPYNHVLDSLRVTNLDNSVDFINFVKSCVQSPWSSNFESTFGTITKNETPESIFIEIASVGGISHIRLLKGNDSNSASMLCEHYGQNGVKYVHPLDFSSNVAFSFDFKEASQQDANQLLYSKSKFSDFLSTMFEDVQEHRIFPNESVAVRLVDAHHFEVFVPSGESFDVNVIKNAVDASDTENKNKKYTIKISRNGVLIESLYAGSRIITNVLDDPRLPPFNLHDSHFNFNDNVNVVRTPGEMDQHTRTVTGYDFIHSQITLGLATSEDSTFILNQGKKMDGFSCKVGSPKPHEFNIECENSIGTKTGLQSTPSDDGKSLNVVVFTHDIGQNMQEIKKSVTYSTKFQNPRFLLSATSTRNYILGENKENGLEAFANNLLNPDNKLQFVFDEFKDLITSKAKYAFVSQYKDSLFIRSLIQDGSSSNVGGHFESINVQSRLDFVDGLHQSKICIPDRNWEFLFDSHSLKKGKKTPYELGSVVLQHLMHFSDDDSPAFAMGLEFRKDSQTVHSAKNMLSRKDYIDQFNNRFGSVPADRVPGSAEAKNNRDSIRI